MNFLARQLGTLAAAALLLATVGGCVQAPPAPQASSQAGREYVRLDPPQKSASGDRIEVIEFFYYGCPICYELEPMLTRWAIDAPADVLVRRVPALASASWENFARLYYALEALGELKRLHWPVYEGFHFEGISLGEEPEMFEWVAQNGIDAKIFLAAYRSPQVQAKVAEAREAIRRYGVKGVPSIAVDGKFLTSARMAGGTRELMPVLDRLVELARKERGR